MGDRQIVSFTVRRSGGRDRPRHVLPLVEGAHAIIHLAAASDVQSRREEVAGPNIEGVWTVLEAARRANVPRCILASSNHVTGQYERESPYREILAGNYVDSRPDQIPLISHE